MIRRYSSSVSPKGQITLPIEIRRELNISPRDHVVFEVWGNQIRVTPERSSLESVYASIPKLPFDYEDGDLEQIVKDERAGEFAVKMRDS